MIDKKNDISLMDFQSQINYENYKVSRIFLMLIAFFETFVFIYEVIISDSNVAFTYTKLLKITVILFCFLFIFLMKRIDYNSDNFKIVIRTMATLLLFWAVTNTFAAQAIIPDISIFILAIYGIAAILVINKKFMFILYTSSYIVFAYGIQFFQHDSVILTG